MMIDKFEARKIVQRFLDSIMGEFQSCIDYEDSLEIIDDITIERPYGWVFFYQSKKCLGTRDFRYMLGGNGPIVIEKKDGMMHHLGTALPPDKEIYQFEVQRFGSSDYQAAERK